MNFIDRVTARHPELHFMLCALLVTEGLDFFAAAGEGRDLEPLQLPRGPPWRTFIHRARL